MAFLLLHDLLVQQTPFDNNDTILHLLNQKRSLKLKPRSGLKDNFPLLPLIDLVLLSSPQIIYKYYTPNHFLLAFFVDRRRKKCADCLSKTVGLLSESVVSIHGRILHLTGRFAENSENALVVLHSVCLISSCT